MSLKQGIEDEGHDQSSCCGPSKAHSVREASPLDEPLLKEVEGRIVCRIECQLLSIRASGERTGHGAPDRVQEALGEQELPTL